MKTIIKIGLMCSIVMMASIFAGCGPITHDADDKMADQTRSALDQAFRETGMPAIVNWAELKSAKMLYELRDNPKLINYVYSKNNYTGLFVYLGRCVGYGIPASVQYSNPVREKRIGPSGYRKYEMVPQPEPNGLFMPAGLSATYVMLINEISGDAVPMYFEDPVTVVGFALPARLVQTRDDLDRWFGSRAPGK
jgi:hypothetical protein